MTKQEHDRITASLSKLHDAFIKLVRLSALQDESDEPRTDGVRAITEIQFTLEDAELRGFDAE